MSPWQVLGIAPTEDTRAIKQAYARALKQTRPDVDPEGYQRLRECYEWALGWVEWQREHPQESEDESEDADEPEHDEPAPIAVRTADAAATSAEVDEGEHMPSRSSPVDHAEVQTQAASAPDSHETRAADSIAEPVHSTDTAHAATPDDTVPDAAIPVVEPGPLLASVREYWQRDGDAALVEALPKLLALLREVPLSLQAEASCRFAAWATQEPLPVEAVAALQEHFDWGRDFRADRVLGDELAAAVRKRLTQDRLLRGTDIAVAEHHKPHSEHQHRHLERPAWPSAAALDEHFHPLSELQRRLLEQPAWRCLLFALSLPGKLASLLDDPTYARGPLHIRLGEQGVSDQQRLFFMLHVALLAALGIAGFALARVAGLDGLASGALSAGAMVAALGMAGFAPLLSVPLDGALNAMRETVPGPLEPGPVRSLLALGLAGLALAWSLGALGVEPKIWAWLGLSAMALLLAWNPNSHWRALLIPGIGLSALALRHHFATTLSNAEAFAIALFGTLTLDLICQRLGQGNRFAHGHFGTLLMYQSIPLVFLAVLGQMGGWDMVGDAALISLLVLLPPLLFHLATQHGVERVLAWLGFSVLICELLLAESPYRAVLLAASPTLLWALLGLIAALAREGAGSAPRRS